MIEFNSIDELSKIPALTRVHFGGDFGTLTLFSLLIDEVGSVGIVLDQPERGLTFPVIVARPGEQFFEKFEEMVTSGRSLPEQIEKTKTDYLASLTDDERSYIESKYTENKENAEDLGKFEH